MSVRVNLLPRESAERQVAVRQRGYAALAGLLLLIVLGIVYWAQAATVNDAEADRDEAQAQLDELQAREAELAEFRDLEERVSRSEDLIATALSHEISFAGLLQDVAAVTPSDVALTEFDVAAVDDVGADGQTVREVVARITAGGESLDGHAPGLERLLIQYDKIASFFGLHFTQSVLDTEGTADAAVFEFQVDVGSEALTRRYEQGTPEELR